MMAQTETSATEHDLFVMLSYSHEVNAAWLENQAMAIEDAIAERCSDVIGPSVTANFEEGGWELDLTILATGIAAVYDKLGQVFKVVEEVAGVEFVAEAPDEVRSGVESHPTSAGHEMGELQPA
jgi:hypothetical protein